MRTRRHHRGAVAAILSLVATALLAVGSAAAHTQSVDPNGGDAGWIDEPISKPWAQAHCHSAAPGVVFEASDGVVKFSPLGHALCSSTITNPGGQVTGP